MCVYHQEVCVPVMSRVDYLPPHSIGGEGKGRDLSQPSKIEWGEEETCDYDDDHHHAMSVRLSLYLTNIPLFWIFRRFSFHVDGDDSFPLSLTLLSFRSQFLSQKRHFLSLLRWGSWFSMFLFEKTEESRLTDEKLTQSHSRLVGKSTLLLSAEKRLSSLSWLHEINQIFRLFLLSHLRRVNLVSAVWAFQLIHLSVLLKCVALFLVWLLNSPNSSFSSFLV